MGKYRKNTVAASRVSMSELVMPNDTNPLGNLMGGKLMQWMDICAAISAQRHCNRNVVTVAVDSVEFVNVIALGEVVVIEGEITRAYRTSMEVALCVWAEDLRTGSKRLCTTSYYSYVAVDSKGKPVPVPPVIPETKSEKQRYEEAQQRRDQRLKHSQKIRDMARKFEVQGDEDIDE